MSTQRKAIGTNLGAAPSLAVVGKRAGTTPAARATAAAGRERKPPADPRQLALEEKEPEAKRPPEVERDVRKLDRHGTISQPYERKRGGGPTRQTTIAVSMDLDLEVQNYYVRHGRMMYPTKAQMWCAAMRVFLSQQHGEGLAREVAEAEPTK